MSYILDALRKSDRERHRDLAPLPQATVRTTTLNAAALPAWLVLGLPALALLALGIAIGWWRPWATPAAPLPIPATAPVAASAAVPTVPGVAVSPPSVASVAPAAALPVPPVPVAKVMPAAPVPVTVVATAGTEKSASVRGDAAGRPSLRPEAAPGAKDGLPEIAISVHAYAEKAAERVVRINGQLLHEGDEIAPGLKLEQIVSDGVVLNYKGQRIRRGL